MLKPAMLYKDELEKLFAEHIYDDDFYFYTGYRYCFTPPDATIQDYYYKWAFVDADNKVIGYLAYHIDDTSDTVNNFGLYSFDRGNPALGRDLFAHMDELVAKHRRIEWRCMGDNPIARTYDRFCAKYNGNKVVFHAVTRGISGEYVDDYIYEIVRER